MLRVNLLAGVLLARLNLAKLFVVGLAIAGVELVAARAFLVELRLVIRDFFWIAIFLISSEV
jgi:hypothetical protein